MGIVTVTNIVDNQYYSTNQSLLNKNCSLETKKPLVMQWRLDEQSKLYCQWVTDS